MRFRRSAAALVAVAALAAVLAGCGAGAQARPGETFTLRIGVIGSGNRLTGPVGYLHDEDALVPLLGGVGAVGAVEVFSFPNGPDLNQALVAGELDLATYGDTPALVARGAGQPTRLIAQAAVGLDAAIVAKKDGPGSLRELAGRRIATQTGSYMHRYLLGALADAAVEPEEVVHIYAADVEAALERGDVDAAAVPAANVEALREKGYPVIDSLAADHPLYRGTSATVVTEDFLAARPGFVAVWQAAQVEATRRAKADWDGYLAFAVEVGGFPGGIVRKTTLQEQLPDTPFTGEGLALLEGTKAFLVEQGFVRKDFAIGEWIAPGARG
ncbi:ABC transporter substrate-binding protein [Nonomuraea sp. NPDC049649]|uniref:ABC transporter substrate-binding protein n=1 Tax=Nonomuraea sp. NPDC049649 TaxID=3155776 RepID=UPI003432DAB5